MVTVYEFQQKKQGNKSEDLLKAMGLLRVGNLVSIVEVDLVNALVS